MDNTNSNEIALDTPNSKLVDSKVKKPVKVKPKTKKRIAKALNSNKKNVIDVHMFPNSKRGELEHVNFMVADKMLTFKANKVSKIDIDNISVMSDNIKKLFTGIKVNAEKHILSYRNTFPVFGYSDKQSKSFKATIAFFYHKANQVCINANRHFSLAKILENLNKADLTYTTHKTYCMVTVTDSSIKKLVPICNALLK